MIEKTALEFFAGIGLMRMGLEKKGWSVEYANDMDPQKFAMYAAHFADYPDHYALQDIHKLNTQQIPSATLATASFPCTDLSLAGARGGLSGKQSSAFWGFTTLLHELDERKPPVILLENVTGFLTSNDGKDFEQAMLALNALGYSVDALVVDAIHFVPQSRQRLFVVGVQAAKKPPARVKTMPGFYESAVRPRQLADYIYLHPNIDWLIRDVPAPPPNSAQLPDILDQIDLTDSAWWSPARAAYLLSQMSVRHRVLADAMIAGNTWSYATVFRRVRSGTCMAELRTDGIAGCLRTPKGGSGRQILFVAGKGQYNVRLLNPRECARLMGADDYNITVPLNQALFGFGDAVCVPVVSWIAENYLNPLICELSLPNPRPSPREPYRYA